MRDGLFVPLNAWSWRTRWCVIAAAAILTASWSALLNRVRLGAAWGLPDVYFYVRLAQGKFNAVPQPFSSRLLAPLLARWIAAAGHWPIEAGFGVVAYLSLLWTLLVVFWLLSRSTAPRWALLAVAAVPFWPQLLGYAGLPDPLYAALLAALLVALECGWLCPAALLMLPLMLARESTTLTLVCLLVVGWRQLRWAGSALAVVSAGAGAALVRYLGAASLANPEHLSGGMYMGGKVISNAFRSLGVVPWSNVYPFLCAAPRWQVAVHLGTVRNVGVCSWSSVAPLQAALAVMVTFGTLPMLLFARRGTLRNGLFGRSLLLRFCLLYGGLSFLLAPALGTWYARLLGYSWPLLLVAVPRLLAKTDREAGHRRVWASLLVQHLGVCALGDRPLGAAGIASIAGLQVAAIALVLVHREHTDGLQESA